MGELPNFLVIGAAKTGTTSLHNYLGQHPEIFMSEIKEPGFFVYEGQSDVAQNIHRRYPFVTDLESYRALFRRVRDEKAIGESSPQYLDLVNPELIARLHRYLPDGRFIAIFRQPVDRAYSYYLMTFSSEEPWSRGREPSIDEFVRQLRADCHRSDVLGQGVSRGPHLAGSYADRISLYLDSFDRSRFNLCLHDDFGADSRAFLRDIFEFLEVDANAEIDVSTRHNPNVVMTKGATRILLSRPNPIRFAARKLLPAGLRVRILSSIADFKREVPRRLDPDLRRELSQEFRPEIHRLEDILQRDLSHWLE